MSVMILVLLLSGLASALAASNEGDSLVESPAVQLRAVQAKLATAEASLREARLKSSQGLLHEKTAELAYIEGRIAELQKAEKTEQTDGAKQDEVLAETHKVLTSPLAAETAALGLPSVTPILVQMANSETSQSAEESRALAEELSTAESAAAGARAEVEYRQKLLQQAAQKLDETAAQSQYGQSKMILQSQVTQISKELREISHADKVTLHDTLAESKRVQEADQEGKMLEKQERQKLVHEKKTSADVEAEIEDQRHSNDQLKETSRKAASLLQKASGELKDSQLSNAGLKKRTFQAMVRQQGAAFLNGTSHSKLQTLRALLKSKKASVDTIQKTASDMTKQALNVTLAVEKEGLHAAVQSAEKTLARQEKRAKRKHAAAKKRILLLQQSSDSHLGELEAKYAAKIRAVKARHSTAIKAAIEKSDSERRLEEYRLRSKATKLEAKLEHEQEVASQKLSASAALLSQVESNLSRVRQDEQQKLDMGEASIHELEAKLQDQVQNLENPIFDASQQVLQQQQAALQLQNSIAAVKKEREQVELARQEVMQHMQDTKPLRHEHQLEDQIIELRRKTKEDLDIEASEMRVLEQKWQKRIDEVKSSKAADKELLLEKIQSETSEEAQEAATARKSLAQLTAVVQQHSKQLKETREALDAEGDLSKAAKKEFQMFRGARAAAAAAR